MKNQTPSHYKGNQEQDWDLIDVIHSQGLNFNKGNVIKYVSRAGKKDDELEDLYKALDYLEREIDYVKKERMHRHAKANS